MRRFLATALRVALGHRNGRIDFSRRRCDVCARPWGRSRSAQAGRRWITAILWPTAMLTVAWGKRNVTRQRDTKRRPRLANPLHSAACRAASVRSGCAARLQRAVVVGIGFLGRLRSAPGYGECGLWPQERAHRFLATALRVAFGHRNGRVDFSRRRCMWPLATGTGASISRDGAACGPWPQERAHRFLATALRCMRPLAAGTGGGRRGRYRLRQRARIRWSRRGLTRVRHAGRRRVAGIDSAHGC